MARFDTDAQTLETLRLEGERSEYPAHLPPIPPLPAARYSDPDFYALELKHVFFKSWLAVGHVSELEKPGAYKLFEELGQSIIISRGIDDEIRAFRNACRHRAAAIVTEPKGVARRFVCPYHSWGYSTEGELKSVPEPQNFACLHKGNLGLHRVRCENWRGFLYINFDDDAISLEEYMAPIAAIVQDFPFEDMTVKGTVVTDIACNWKTGYDNFLESYHINTVHRKTIAPFIDTKTWTLEGLPHGHGCLRTMKRGGSQTLFRSENISDEGIAGKVSERYRAITVAIPRFPNTTAGLDPAGFNWQSFWPTGPDTMRMVNLYLGPDLESPEADRKYWDDFISYNDTILAEDMYLFPSMQRSMSEGDISHLMLSTQEHYIQWYHEHLDKAIGTQNIPESLRVQQVLSGEGTTGA